MRYMMRAGLIFSLLCAAGGVARAEGAPTPVGERAPITVVVDPGHGGSNLGAASPATGLREKQLTLAVARALRGRLEHDGLRVVLTRERDEYLTLGERVRRANGAGGQLFVSIHANASPAHDRSGVETYVAARHLVDAQAVRAGEGEDVAQAMARRAEVRATAESSIRLARSLESHLAQLRGGDRGVRQAPYDVLDGATLPAALVEIGFIDHAVEGPLLAREETIAATADALADAIREYLGRTDGAVAAR